MLRVAAAALVLALSGVAVAADAPAWDEAQLAQIEDRARVAAALDGTHEARTPHYRVRADAGARFAAEVGTYLELVRDRVIGVLGVPLREREMTDVVVYASRGRYRARFGQAVNSRGRFDWNYEDERAAPTYLLATFQERAERGLADCIPILNHESTHQVLQAAAGRRQIPWLVQEGIATYFQTWDFFHDDAWNRAHRKDEFGRELATACAHHALPTLGSLAALQVWDADGFGPITNTRYGCAESLIAFLLADPARRGFATRLIGRALAGDDVSPLLRDGDGAAIEAGWRAEVAALAQR